MYRITAILFVVFFVDTSNGQDDYRSQREQMVKTQLLARDIIDPSTLRAMRQVKRHEFVPPSMKKFAYTDGALAIGHNQTISQPYIVAYMTQELKLKPKHRVLEIGTGSGYQAAVLAKIVDSVYTIEIVESLGIDAKKRLDRLGYQNIICRIGDGYHGWPDKAPFDAIIVTAAVQEIPPALIDQLAEGGRMIIPVGQTRFHRNLILVTRKNGKIKTKKRIPVVFVPFTRKNE
ncbi:MAG: protein-L-isoaspartate(D-aspartate) O-methyltransferase [Flavobacteriaceae bacterium]|nr:protein-L-isoaspartate(D-aspartate) O-methyltransferase [Flavobacteriaceae bacterium]